MNAVMRTGNSTWKNVAVFKRNGLVRHNTRKPSADRNKTAIDTTLIALATCGSSVASARTIPQENATLPTHRALRQ